MSVDDGSDGLGLLGGPNLGASPRGLEGLGFLPVTGGPTEPRAPAGLILLVAAVEGGATRRATEGLVFLDGGGGGGLEGRYLKP